MRAATAFWSWCYIKGNQFRRLRIQSHVWGQKTSSNSRIDSMLGKTPGQLVPRLPEAVTAWLATTWYRMRSWYRSWLIIDGCTLCLLVAPVTPQSNRARNDTMHSINAMLTKIVVYTQRSSREKQLLRCEANSSLRLTICTAAKNAIYNPLTLTLTV